MRWSMVILAVVGFALSIAVHLSTYFGVNPGAHIPWFWVLHVVLFVPCIAGIVYVNRATKQLEGGQDHVWMAAPSWLSRLVILMFIYAFVNFLVFMMFQEGSPAQEGSRYYLHNHGDLIRDITEAEYHYWEARIARGFSGHWMVFYCGAICMLIGADRVERGVYAPKETSDKKPKWWEDREPTAEERAAHRVELRKPVSKSAGVGSLVLLLAVIFFAICGQPVTSLISALVLSPFGVKYLRRQAMRKDKSFETMWGFLAAIPLFIIFIMLIRTLANASYIAVAVGIREAAAGSVQIIRGGDEPVHLSNGDPLVYYWVYSAAFVGLFFVGAIFCFFGMIYLIELYGRWLKQERRRKTLESYLRSRTRPG